MSEYFHNGNTRSDRIAPVAARTERRVVTKVTDLDGNVTEKVIVIRRFSAHNAYAGARSFEKRGGLSSGPTGGNSIGFVPAAFRR